MHNIVKTKKSFTMLKNILHLVSFLFLFCSSCDSIVPTSTVESTDITDYENALPELIKGLTRYSIEGAYSFYNAEYDYVDIESLEKYIMLSEYSNITKSRSTQTFKYNEELRNIFSPEACTVLLEYFSFPQYINSRTLNELKQQFDKFSDSDKTNLNIIYSTAYIAYDELQKAIDNQPPSSRAVDGRTCTVLATLSGAAGGWFIGAAIGGPIGLIANLAFNVATSLAGYERC